MTDTHSGSADEPRATASASVVCPTVFINYRHEDTQEAALRLYDRFERRFGAENVFLDVRSLGEGTDWLETIKEHGAKGSVFLALVGRHWLSTLKEREPRSPGDPQDYVVLELALALTRWPGKVIPVLHAGADMPGEERLPKQIRRLASLQAMKLHPLSFEADAQALLSSVEAFAPELAKQTTTPPSAVVPELATRVSTELQTGAPEHVGPTSSDETPASPDEAAAIPLPDGAHYDEVLECMLDEGALVPVLGSGVRGSLPDAKQLAEHLAKRYGWGSQSLELAEIAQRVLVAKGPDDLKRAIREVFTPQPEPDDTHRFLANIPTRLSQLGLPNAFQLIVTTNYDSALEQAFKSATEPYDLAVYLANGTDRRGTNRGKFVHVPAEGEPEVIHDTSKYFKFPINADFELERTVIVQINGAAEGGEGAVRWDGNYVLTEDQYIDYLVADEMVRVIPAQILNKLQESHCLFLGYEAADWSLRVFLKRIWQGQPLWNRSWAVEHEPDALEKQLWRSLNVDLLASAPNAYLNGLDTRMASRRARGS